MDPGTSSNSTGKRRSLRNLTSLSQNDFWGQLTSFLLSHPVSPTCSILGLVHCFIFEFVLSAKKAGQACRLKMASSKSLPQSKFLKRFRFRLLSYFRFLFISCPRVRLDVTTKTFSLAGLFSFRLSNKSFVSVGQGSAQDTPSSSPEKVYTPLKVAAHDPLKPTLDGESPIEASLQIVENATEKISPNPGPPGSPSERHDLRVPSQECQLTGTSSIITKSPVTTKPMEAPLGDFAQDSFGGLNPPGISQTSTPTFNQLI